jgi:hypothetical protein|tara:strand:- start:1352 stop:1969 length:618 start_codon:yes stop_codon:yes gene_type:complete
MATLGSTGKADANRFNGKKKLLLIPLIPIFPDMENDISDLLDRFWAEIFSQVGNIESVLGTVKHVFHEMIHEENENGIQILSQVYPRSANFLKEYINSGAKLEALEVPETWMELTDWQRCLSIGLISKKVFDIASKNYQEISIKRTKQLPQTINDLMEKDEVGLLFISEGHAVQFPSDIQIFYVSPPSAKELKDVMAERMNKQTP